MFGKSARLGALAALVVLFGLASAAHAQDMHRLVWQYDGGFFKDEGRSAWVEKNSRGTYHFEEVHRNREFVELYDASRDLTIRLYGDACFIQHATSDPVHHHDFNRLYFGRWGA
jgi:hypothetical protein